MVEPVRALITGGAGQLVYALILLIGKGDVFGPNQPVILHLLDIPESMAALRGVVMEIEDCALPLIRDVIATDNLEVAFKDIDAAFLVGSVPRKPGMERKDLLAGNAKIFKEQGQALDKWAKKTVKVLVVGNPANTNALICAKYAPSIPKESFSAMTRLDQNRVTGMIAKRLNVPANKVKNTIVWGNHSPTQFPDLRSASVDLPSGQCSAYDAIKDEEWIKGDFIRDIQQRGSAVIQARQKSSAMSAAKAAADHMRDLWHGTPDNEHVSMGVISDGSYGVAKDIVFSFPVTIKNKTWAIVNGLHVDDFAREKLRTTENELLQEKKEAMQLCQD